VKAQQAVQELQARGHRAACVVGNALDETFPTKAVGFALDVFGKINCLINNAGMW
jgi:NAD(P)-dependent dehydrogenase (short-subunit alcohol dehydrogenase family)